MVNSLTKRVYGNPWEKCEFGPKTKFSAVMPIINRSSVRNFRHVTLLAARILRWSLVFLEKFFPLINIGSLEVAIIVAQVTGLISLKKIEKLEGMLLAINRPLLLDTWKVTRLHLS